MSKWIALELIEGKLLINSDFVEEIGMELEYFTIKNDSYNKYEVYFGYYDDKKYREYYKTEEEMIARYDFLKKLLTS